MKITGTTIETIKPNIPGIVLLSHGPLSSGLLGSLRLICGEVENVTAFELEEGDDPQDYRNAFASYYEAYPEHSIFLIDVFGGTPFNEVLKYFLGKQIPIRALCGVNLGMLMEACVVREQSVDYLDSLEAIGQQAVVNIGQKWENRT